MSVFGVFIAAVQHQPQWAEVGVCFYVLGLIVAYTNTYSTLKQIKGEFNLKAIWILFSLALV